jgi:hypothetical protein
VPPIEQEPDRGWPNSSPQHGVDRVEYPQSPEQAERVLEAAYQLYRDQKLSYDEYTLQKNICHQIACAGSHMAMKNKKIGDE